MNRRIASLEPPAGPERLHRWLKLLFDLVRQPLAGKIRLEIGDHAILHRHMRLDGMAADMRGQHDVREAGQRVRRMRLFLEHVETGAGDGLVGERRASAARLGRYW